MSGATPGCSTLPGDAARIDAQDDPESVVLVQHRLAADRIALTLLRRLTGQRV